MVKGFSGKRWPQHPEEIERFIAFLVSQDVRSYLEVGCRYGDTWHAVGCALPVGSRLVGIDLPGTKPGTPRNAHPFSDSAAYLARARDDLVARGQDAHVVIGDSHARETVAATAALGPFDAVLIDGDHNEAGVRQDWQDYGPMAALVAFHDIARERGLAQRVRKIYHAAREDRRYLEFVASGGFGIGVVCR